MSQLRQLRRTPLQRSKVQPLGVHGGVLQGVQGGGEGLQAQGLVAGVNAARSARGESAWAPRQGDSGAAGRVDALEAGDYGGAGPEEEEEEDFAERFTRCLLEDASGGY
mgnify:CR=1 FL=1